MPYDDASQREWEKWQELCTLLREMGVVTDDDLQSSVQVNATPGQRLLNKIRAWGDLNAELAMENAERDRATGPTRGPSPEGRGSPDL